MFGRLLAAFLILQIPAGIFLAEVTVRPGRKVLSPQEARAEREIAGRLGSELTDATIVARDGAKLQAWSIHPLHGNGNAVILLHGLGDDRAGMNGYAELFLARENDVLMPDARAHGASGGNLATFGLLESDDIHRWLDWLEQNDHPACIYGLGESMGAAQLLQSLRAESRFCAVVAESPFASFREIGYDRMGQRFHTGPWLGRTLLRPLVEFAFLYGDWKYKQDLTEASPELAIAGSKVPVFLIHGIVDSNIPLRHSRLIVAHNPGVSLWEVPNVDHCGAMSVAPEEFADRVIGWMNRHTR